jgi:ribonuclease-3
MRLGRGEDTTGGRTRPLNLARLLEAVTGAVFIDKGFRATERWLLRLLEPELAALNGGEPPEDVKSRLQHTAQLLYAMTPRYHVVSTEGPDHDKLFTVAVVLGQRSIAAGRGRSKRTAEREAAEAALRAIAAEQPAVAAGAATCT